MFSYTPKHSRQNVHIYLNKIGGISTNPIKYIHKVKFLSFLPLFSFSLSDRTHFGTFSFFTACCCCCSPPPLATSPPPSLHSIDDDFFSSSFRLLFGRWFCVLISSSSPPPPYNNKKKWENHNEQKWASESDGGEKKKCVTWRMQFELGHLSALLIHNIQYTIVCGFSNWNSFRNQIVVSLFFLHLSTIIIIRHTHTESKQKVTLPKRLIDGKKT